MSDATPQSYFVGATGWGPAYNPRFGQQEEGGIPKYAETLRAALGAPQTELEKRKALAELAMTPRPPIRCRPGAAFADEELDLASKRARKRQRHRRRNV